MSDATDGRAGGRYEVGFLSDLALDGEASTAGTDRQAHDADYGTDDADAVAPDAVAYAASTADVSRVLAAANDRGVPVTPFAGGTGLEGAATPTARGISLDLSRLDRVIEVRPDDLQVDVGAGVIGDDLNDRLARYGLFFPPLPSSGEAATIGGMIATDASGMKTVKYGEVADWVLGVEAVLADGRVLELGGRAAKTSSGYNLLDLLVGSEGTLGVVTRATLEVAGRPEQIRGGRAAFPTLAAATEAIGDAVASGVDAATLELLDAETVRIANAHSGTRLPETPTVFLEFHANHGIETEIEFCRDVFEAHGVERFEVAGESDMDDLWEARRDLAYATRTWDPDRDPIAPGDVTVPIGSYADLVGFVKEVADETGLAIPCFGHAGDGNLHYSPIADVDDPAELAAAERAYERVVDYALELGGTATGEHGIGEGKRGFMRAEHGDAVDVMRSIKATLDPAGILNPGTALPVE